MSPHQQPLDLRWLIALKNFGWREVVGGHGCCRTNRLKIIIAGGQDVVLRLHDP